MRYPGQQLTMAPSPSSGGQLEAGKATPSEIAERFRVSPSFMAKLWQRWRCSGRCAALPHAGGTSRHLKDHLETRRPEVAQQPDATLEEVRDRVVSAHGPQVSHAPICRALQRLRLLRTKSRSTPRSVQRTMSRTPVEYFLMG